MNIAQFVVVLILKSVCEFVHLTSRLLVSWMVGARFTEVGLFAGRTLVEFHWRGVTWKLGLIPIGNRVRYRTDETDPDRFELLPAWKRLFIYGSGVGGLMLLACVCLGPTRAIRSIEKGFEQIVMGFTTPGFARAMVGQLYALIEPGSTLLVLGIIAAKVAAINLIPLPPLDGGKVLFELLLGEKWMPSKVYGFVAIVGLTASMLIILLWGYTFVMKAVSP